jgi:hypothetical protein
MLLRRNLFMVFDAVNMVLMLLHGGIFLIRIKERLWKFQEGGVI